MSQLKEMIKQDKQSQATTAKSYKSIRPNVDIFEDKSGITLKADLPGVPKERLDIQIDNEILSIDGAVEIATLKSQKETEAIFEETRYQRSFSLGRELDIEQVEAMLQDGVLALRIPKRQEYQPRKIEIRTA
jgi:HSP20 family molecular chaperone IbpA